MPEFILPCGYIDPESPSVVHKTVELVEMTGFEEDILTDKQKHQNKTVITEVISRCMVSLGSIRRPRETRDKFFMPYLDNLLASDETFLVVRLRQVSLGDEFIFSTKCPACDHLHPRMNFDLNSLEVTSWAEDEHLDRQWEVALPSGKKAVVKGLTVRDVRRAQTLLKQNKQDLASSALMQRIVTLDDKKVTSLHQLKEMSAKDRSHLRSFCERVDAGINTDIELVCDACAAPWTTTLPAGDKGFFFPSETGP